MKHRFFKHATATLLTGVLAASMMPAVALAEVGADGAYSTEGYVRVALTPASTPIPELLGGVAVENASDSSAPTAGIAVADLNLTKASHIRYLLFGSEEYQQSVDPTIANVLLGKGERPVYNRHSGADSSVKMPGRALLPYDEAVEKNDTDASVWDMKPDVIVGNHKTNDQKVDYDTDEYAGAAAKANGWSDYHPLGASYHPTDTYAQVVEAVYNCAQAMDQVVANSKGTKKLRYDETATEIAIKWENYVKGLQGYILKCLERDGKEKKTFVYVSSYNSDTKTFVCETSPDPLKMNRLMETCRVVGTNAADGLAGTTEGVKDTTVNMTAEQLDSVDLIILPFGEKNLQNDLGALVSKAFWTDGESGVIYQSTSNNMEVSQNFGRVLGCLYDEYISQADIMAYYYDSFYHLKAGKLGEVMEKVITGTRNWANKNTGEMTTWTKDSIKGYDRAAVQAKLDDGALYIKSLGDDAPSDIKMTKYLSDSLEGMVCTEHQQVIDTPAVAATCGKAGSTAAWHCPICGHVEAAAPVAKKAHSAKKVAQVDPTFTKAGAKAYYYCGECKGKFTSSACTTSISKPASIAKLTKASVKSIKAGKRSITVKIKKGTSKATKYRVSYRMKGASKWSSKTTTKTSLKIAKLKKGKKYQVKVVTYAKANGKTCSSSASAVKTSKKVA